MNRTINLLATAATALLLAACTQDTDEKQPGGKDSDVLTDVTITLTPEVPQQVETRAPGVTVDENVIKNIFIVQFDNTGKHLVAEYITGSNITTYTGRLQNTPGKIYVIANTNTDIDFWLQGMSSANEGFTEQVLLNYQWQIYQNDDASLLPGNAVIMSGVYIGTPTAKINIPMQRILTKVQYNVTTSLPAGHSFELSTVQVKHIPGFMILARDNPNSVPFPIFTSAFDDLVDSDNPPEDLFRSTASSDYWYLPENCRGTGTATSELQKNADTAPAGQADYCTYLEIKGKYTSNTNWVGALNVTYRIYLGGNNTNDYNLRRNTNYTVNTVIKGANRADTRITVTGTANAATYLDYTDNFSPWVAVALADADQSNITQANWMTGTGTGSDGSRCPAGWRTPTFEELILMYVYNSGVPQNINSTVYYLTNGEWGRFKFAEGTGDLGSAPKGYVRCVRDI